MTLFEVTVKALSLELSGLVESAKAVVATDPRIFREKVSLIAFDLAAAVARAVEPPATPENGDTPHA